jgi:hypothetical protein
MSFHKDYFTMVGQWDDICSLSLSTPEKTDACLAILRDFIDRLALLSARAPNAFTRLASMLEQEAGASIDVSFGVATVTTRLLSRGILVLRMSHSTLDVFRTLDWCLNTIHRISLSLVVWQEISV